MFQLNGDRYTEANLTNSRFWIPSIELGLGVWEGSYKNVNMLWLRWYDKNGNWVLTPAESEKQRANQEKQRADQEKQRADQERQRADQERQKTEKLIAQLRALGVEPDID
jgi:hypothetical protein